MRAEVQGSVGGFGEVASHAITETATPIIASEISTSIGDATLSVGSTGQTDLVEGKGISLTGDGNFAVPMPYFVNTVRESSPSVASLSADSSLVAFLSGRMRIPGIESGTPLAALDVACQAGGSKRQTGPNANDTYWSLAGHSVGFTADGEIVQPKTVDRTLQNNVVLATGGTARREIVQYQEITDAIGIGSIAADGYPRRIDGDTVQHTRERTYVKFTIPAVTAGATSQTTFSLEFGPSFRRNASNTPIANTTALRVIVYSGPTNGYVQASANAQTATGASQGQTMTSSSVADFARTRTITVTIEIHTSGGQLFLNVYPQSDTGYEDFVSASTGALSATASILYSRRWNIARAASANGIRDLITRRSATEAWGSIEGVSYALPQKVAVEGGVGSVAGSPIAPFEGELWDYVKQVCAARQVELVAKPTGLTLRAPAITVIPTDDRVTASRAISGAVVARNVAIVNHRTRALDSAGAEVFKAETLYTVGVGETKTFDIRVGDGVRFVASPRPWYNSKATNGISFPLAQYADDATALEAGVAGRYYITAQDGFPVSPVAWSDYGGRVTVAVKDGVATLTLIGPRTAIPGIAGPFRLGESSGNDYAVLRLFGTGTTIDQQEVVIPSGAAFSQTRVEKASPVTNIAVGSIGEVYDVAAWAAQRAAGPNISLTLTMPTGLLAGWGMTPGALIEWKYNIFRVDSVSFAIDNATLSATRLTRLSDMPGKDRTLTQFAADYAGMTCHDYSIRPLALTAPAQNGA